MQPVRTISILALSFLVLVSSTHFMVGIHYCSGDIQNIAFLSKASACETELQAPPCHRHMAAPCCDDETIVHKSQEVKSAASQIHIITAAAMVAELPGLVSEIIPSAPSSRNPYNTYDPPLRWHDITISNQIFLI